MLFLTLIYVTFVSLGLPDVLLGAAWPDMRVEFMVGLDAAGPISMVISGMTIVSGLMCGVLLRRFGTGRVVAYSTLLTAVAMLGFGLAPGYWWLFPLAIPYGFGAGAIDTAINDYVARNYTARHMNWLHAMWGLGAMLGPVILSFAIVRSGWRGGYLWVGGVQIVLSVLLIATIPAWQRRDTQAVQMETSQVQSVTIRETIAVPGVKLSMLAFFLYCSAEMGLTLWGASYLTIARGMDTVSAAMWVSVFFGGITAGRMISGFAAMRLSSRALLRAGEAASLLGAVLIALPLPAGVSAAGMLLFGLGLAPLFPTMLHLTPARFGERFSARAISLQIAFAYVGSTLFPPVVGWVSNITGIGILPYLLIALVLLMLAISLRIDRRLEQG